MKLAKDARWGCLLRMILMIVDDLAKLAISDGKWPERSKFCQILLRLKFSLSQQPIPQSELYERYVYVTSTRKSWRMICYWAVGCCAGMHTCVLCFELRVWNAVKTSFTCLQLLHDAQKPVGGNFTAKLSEQSNQQRDCKWLFKTDQHHTRERQYKSGFGELTKIHGETLRDQLHAGHFWLNLGPQNPLVYHVKAGLASPDMHPQISCGHSRAVKLLLIWARGLPLLNPRVLRIPESDQSLAGLRNSDYKC